MKYIKYFIVISCIFITSCLCFMGREDEEPRTYLIRRVYKIRGSEINDNILWGYDSYFYKCNIRFKGKVSGKVRIRIYERPESHKNDSSYTEYEFNEGIVNHEGGGEWYSEYCIIKIIPEDSSISGEVEFTFKAFTFSPGRASDIDKEKRGY